MKTISVSLVLLLANMFPVAAQIADGLVAYYPCNGNFNDVSGNNNHATVFGASLGSDKSGNPSGAYIFDGVDDYVSVPNIGPYTSFTLMARVKFTSTELMNIFSGQNGAWYPSVSSGKLRWYDGSLWQWSTSAINNNQWHDIAYVFDNGVFKIYVDGILEFSAAGPSSYSNGLVNLVGRLSIPERYYNGSLDDIRIYDRALSASEINIAFNGYPVSWADITGMTLNADNSLTKSDGLTAWSGAAISYNRMEPNQDGWIEFTTGSYTGFEVIGLSEFRTEVHHGTINYGFYFHNNTGLYTYQPNASMISLGTFSPGETFRIAREGTSVKFYRNGVVVHTASADPSRVLHADFSAYTNGSRVPPVTTSMERQMIVKHTIVNPVFENNFTGSVSLDVSGGDAPYTYAWSSGETSPSITEKSIGQYSVTITDATSRQEVRQFFLGCNIAWGDLVNMAVNPDNSLTKTDGVNNWTGGAVSYNRLEANQDGWLHFITPVPSANILIGLSTYRPDPGYGQFDNAFFMNSSYLYIYEYSNAVGLGTFKPGERLSILREGSQVKYYRNDNVVRTVTVNPNKILYADISVFTSGATVPPVTASFNRPSLTFYARASGTWSDTNTWSLTEGGTSAAMSPNAEDSVIIRGFTVNVTGNASCSSVLVDVIDGNTSLIMDGSNANLQVLESVRIRRDGNGPVGVPMVAQGGGKVSVGSGQ